MDQRDTDRLLALMALGQTKPLSEALAHLGALNLELAITIPLEGSQFKAQEKASAANRAFMFWAFLCRAMVRLEDQRPLAAENGRELAARVLDAFKLSAEGE